MQYFGGGTPGAAGGTRTCPSCGAPVEPDDMFCIMCGVKLPGANAAAPAAPAAPAASGRATPPNPGPNRTVLVTGAPAGAADAFNAILGGAPAGAPAPQPAGGFGGGVGTCPSCGAPLVSGGDFCTNCGARLSTASPQAAAPAPAAPSPAAPGDGAQGKAPSTPGGTVLVFGPGQTPGPAAGGTPTPAPAAPPTPRGAHFAQPGLKPTIEPEPAPVQPTVGEASIKGEISITSRPHLVILSREEARSGCSKVIEVDGQSYSVDIPAGVTADTAIDLPGLGYFDTQTGERGSLRLSFFID